MHIICICMHVSDMYVHIHTCVYTCVHVCKCIMYTQIKAQIDIMCVCVCVCLVSVSVCARAHVRISDAPIIGYALKNWPYWLKIK